MKTQCPRCRQMYEVEDKYEGQVLTCSTCKEDFMVEKQGSRTVLHKDVPANIPEFKVPVTVKILRGIALFFFVIGTLAAALMVYAKIAGKAGVVELAVGLLSTYLTALAVYVCAQVVRFLAEIAHNTGITARK
jgi:hypothetical protein